LISIYKKSNCTSIFTNLVTAWK